MMRKPVNKIGAFGQILCNGRSATCQCDRHWGVSRRREFSDDAKRFADEVSLHLTASTDNAVGQWIAIALQDGSSPDHTLYPSRSVAAAHQSDANLYLYFRIPPDGLSVREAAAGLQWERAKYDAGLTFSATCDQELIQPITQERIAEQLNALRRL